MAVIIRFDLDVSEMASWLLSYCRREVQNEIKFHQQKRRKAYLYALTFMQNEPYPLLCQPEFFDRRKFAACFISNLFYSQIGLLKYENSIVLNLLHDMMT